MEKSKKNAVIAIAVVVVVILALLILVFFGGKNGYRMIKIYEFDGMATITREEQGEITPYSNMLLESGDNVCFDEGIMTLKFDDDKYAYVEEKTEFALRAEGDSERSKTTITIEKGSITNEIQNPLNSDASYEVNTPNSTMAVRGTTFRVSTYYDEKGVCYTRVSVFEGEVTSALVYPDGKVSTEKVSVSAGKEVIIYEDDNTTDYLTEVTDIDYSTLPEDVVDLIENITGKEIMVDAENQNEADGEETSEDISQDITQYSVTFLYSGEVFATQQIVGGECATIPSLMPSASGEWDFDFSTPITQDTEITWKE
ncbi:MAG: FecR domain-containing protein [Lachnospiraceae bacterium]|nr:FecR domain-containing protein [Lachnospiraceae bacterium]